MKKLIYFFIPLVIFSFTSCNTNKQPTDMFVISPDRNIKVEFYLTSSGQPAYKVSHMGKIIIEESALGFKLKNAPPLKTGWSVISTDLSEFNETWQMSWGEQLDVVNHFNQLIVGLKEAKSPNRLMNVTFRVYDDGLGFRFEFPKQPNMDTVIIMDENTRFNLTGNHLCWWQPGDWDIYEHLYHKTRFSEIDALQYRNHPNLAQTYIPENAVNTPITMKTDNGLYLSFHEANLTDYAGMTLKILKDQLMMQCKLVGSDRLGYKVKRTTPFETPWRTIQISETAGGLIESKLIVNLNEPNKLGDVSWFKPTKYTGIWWAMHLGKYTWGYSSGKHGATTERAKKLIDFSAKNNIHGMLVEGWNIGWEAYDAADGTKGKFDFVTPYPDYNLKEVVEYGKKKGVDLIMHHETQADPENYEAHLDEAFKLMNKLGIHTVKTGYVGKIKPAGEYHHGQYMVNHYRKVLETAAKYQVAVDAHEPIKATGIRRTYPNAVSREGLRGQEFNAWASDGGNPPEHLCNIAFTRMLAGPIDYTPGIFNIKLKPYKPNNQVNTTLAQQLALYVVIYSPVQMVADLPENYDGNPAFQFIRDVGVNWKQTKVLNGEPGDFVTIAREERETGNWFIGSITDENPRTLQIKLDFLEPGIMYNASIYADGQDADWDSNPTSIKIEHKQFDSNSELTLNLAPGGGCAISLIKQ